MLTFDSQTFTWLGRRLTNYAKGSTSAAYSYNSDGIRTKKTVGSAATEYMLNGSQILAEQTGSTMIKYFYDSDGKRASFKTGNKYYFYVYNVQGDVTHIVDTDKNVVATYEYDPYGKILNLDSLTAIGKVNPFRYRGYYYDSESNLYYLNSRYYNPEIGRFINADGYVSTGQGVLGNNMFAYCGNNPVNRTDSTGNAWWHWAIGAAVVAVAAVATVVTCGGFAAAVGAVAAVGSGMAATSVASTIAAGAFIGSASVYGIAVLSAASTSNSVQEFNDQGNWGTVVTTAFGGLTGGYDGYTMYKAQATQTVAVDDTFLPDSFYSKHASKQSTPNSSYTNYTYNNYTGKYEKSTAYYDFAGRQNIRIDWTNHGYADHGNPHVHYTTYNAQYRDGFTIRWD